MPILVLSLLAALAVLALLGGVVVWGALEAAACLQSALARSRPVHEATPASDQVEEWDFQSGRFRPYVPWRSASGEPIH